MNNRLQKMWCGVAAMLDRLGNRPRLLLLLFAGIYFVGFSLIASKGVISNDELFTLYIARLPHFRDVWAALATGAEQTPPLFYAVSRADIKLFGTSGLALRLPEMLAFFLMGAVLFHIVARRTSPVYGFLALLFPFMTTAFNYVFEARAYALVLCFSVTGLLCWIWATEGRHRVPALVGLALSLAAAISSHYYAVLSLFPIGLGEAVRTFRRKKIDVGVWLALLLSLSPLVAFLPLIESARKFAPHFWSKPHWSSIVYFYDYFLLTPSVIPLLAILLVVVASSVFRKPAEDTSEAGTLKSVPEHEIAGVLGFLMIPAVGIVLAKTAVGAFSDRYALPAVIGLCIVIAWGLHSVLRGQRVVAVGLGLLLLAFLVVKEVNTWRRTGAYRALQASTYSFLETYARGNAPIVISGPLNFAELTYAPPRNLAGRLTYLADPRLALQYSGTDDAEKGLVEMQQWAGLNVLPFHTFVASGRACYIYVDNFPDQHKWTIPELRALNWRLTLVAWQQDMILFRATPIGKASGAGD